MTTAPSNLRAHLQQQTLELTWPDSEQSVNLSFQQLRGSCPCANCVNELTGVRTFHPKDAASDIHPQKMELVGNYAVKIFWSDQHRTGLYTWKYLKKLCEAAEQESP